MENNNVILNGTPAKRLIECRKAANLTQAKLADLSGYSIQHISRIENNKQRLTYDTALELCKHLNTTPDYLLCNSPAKNNTDNYLSKLCLDISDDLNLLVRLLLNSCQIFVNESELSSIGVSSLLNSVMRGSVFDPKVNILDTYKNKTISISVPIDSNLNQKNIIVSQYSLIVFISDIIRYAHLRSIDFFEFIGCESLKEIQKHRPDHI